MHKGVGLVSQVFTAITMAELKGHYAIGHTRYSTTGSSLLQNAQPFMIETIHGPLALAHNGNLVNSAELRNELMQQGVGFSSSSDTEVMTMMLARNGGATWEERIKTAMKKWVGAYSLVILLVTACMQYVIHGDFVRCVLGCCQVADMLSRQKLAHCKHWDVRRSAM